jgi:hypothetical protein
VVADAPNPFRHANLRLLELVSREPLVEEIPFICECDDPGCFGTVQLSAAEFEQICVDGGFVTLRGHSGRVVRR